MICQNEKPLLAVAAENTEETAQQAPRDTVIRAVPNQQITHILANYNISLAGTNKNAAAGSAGQKVDGDTKNNENQKKFVVQKQTTSLFLYKNEFRTLVGLSNVLEDVMWNHQQLQWIDLSYNYLETIEEELIKTFPHLKTLYLHGNFIANLDETKKLGRLKNLTSLTLYGNPIEQISGYRMWVLGVLYDQNDTLKKLDQVLVTAKEFDAVCVWNETINASQSSKLKKLKPQNAKKPPAPKQDESEKK